MARSSSATFRSIKWPRKSTPILRQDNDFSPRYGFRARYFGPRRTRPPTAKVWINATAQVALGVMTIHSPRRCGALPRRALSSPARTCGDSLRRLGEEGLYNKMKLTRLRLIGFKSFVEPADFAIEPGLTGVVGPNGCEKSNLVEAVRWVMGEASYKAMRAAEMDDVIFSGNTERPSRNHAEVSVLVDNADRKAPASFNEFESLEVSRRIMREHGSTFRVNGREVRARDVAMLFADASTGSRSPALVHQGRIGEIIQARPDQRRRVLEEAAGISGLHARRHEAELRLKAAEHNLTRVDDVIGQLAGQIAALKTQARQAVRYRNISSQVRRTEALLFHLRWTAARTEVEETRRGKDEAVRVVAARLSEQTLASTQQTQVAAALPALRDAEAKAAAGLQRLLIARETLEREEARAKERIAELDRRIEQFAADLVRERSLAADAEAALARLAGEKQTLGELARETGARLNGVNSRLASAESALAGSEKSFADLTGALADLTARRNQLEAALREHDQRAARLDTELAEIDASLAASGSGAPELSAFTGTLASAKSGARSDGKSVLAEAESVAQDAEAKHRRAREEVDAARGPLAAAEKTVQRLETETKTIGKLLAIESKNLWPPVIDDITVIEGYEKALGAALGDDLDAPVGSSAPMHWSGAAERRSAPVRICQSARGAPPPPGADRRGRTRQGRHARQGAQGRPASGLARRRPVALGRLCGRGACSDRRRAPACRTRSPANARERTRRRAQRLRSQTAYAGTGRGRARRRCCRGRHGPRRRTRDRTQRRARFRTHRGEATDHHRARREHGRARRGRASADEARSCRSNREGACRGDRSHRPRACRMRRNPRRVASRCPRSATRAAPARSDRRGPASLERAAG